MNTQQNSLADVIYRNMTPDELERFAFAGDSIAAAKIKEAADAPVSQYAAMLDEIDGLEDELQDLEREIESLESDADDIREKIRKIRKKMP